MQCSKRAVCFCLIENVTVHAYVYSNGTFFCNAASCVCPYHFAENMVKCTEITTGEDLGVTGFGLGKRLKRMQNENQRTIKKSSLIKRRSMYE